MTRDGALKICVDNTSAIGEPYMQREQLSNNLVSCLEALGLLKFDEPPAVNQKLYDAISHTPLMADLIPILDAIENAGLKLVEK